MGQVLGLEYHDAASFDELPNDKCRQVYGVCFAGGKLVIGFGGHKNGWGLIGGTIEPGETYRQTLDREIVEEANMNVLDASPIGYQIVTDAGGSSMYQLRYWCRVEPIGTFVADPDGGIKKIKRVSPTDYKDYFDWGQIGDHIVRRGISIDQLASKK